MSKTAKNGYGSFMLAATAYIAGVLLFSFWSYNAHRNALHGYIDKSLMDAAFATEEILGIDFVNGLVEEHTKQDKAYVDAKEQLTRMARHGDFGTVGSATVHQHVVEIQIAGSSISDPLDRDLTEDLPVSSNLKDEIIRLAETGHHNASLITAQHPVHGPIRHAIIYKAANPGHGVAFIAAQQSGYIEQQLGDQMLRNSAAAIAMLILAIPLITLFNRTHRSTARNLTQLNSRLQNDVEIQKNREEELKDAISDLERFNAVSSGRETRIIELKAEVNELLDQMKRTKRYNIDKIE